MTRKPTVTSPFEDDYLPYPFKIYCMLTITIKSLSINRFSSCKILLSPNQNAFFNTESTTYLESTQHLVWILNFQVYYRKYSILLLVVKRNPCLFSWQFRSRWQHHTPNSPCLGFLFAAPFKYVPSTSY
jgi:hypothetical protein